MQIEVSITKYSLGATLRGDRGGEGGEDKHRRKALTLTFQKNMMTSARITDNGS